MCFSGFCEVQENEVNRVLGEIGNKLVGNISYPDVTIYQVSSQLTPGPLLRARKSYWKTVKKMLEILLLHNHFVIKITAELLPTPKEGWT